MGESRPIVGPPPFILLADVSNYTPICTPCCTLWLIRFAAIVGRLFLVR